MDFNFNNIEGSAKYKKLLNTGTDLFFKYGAKRVSVEEICGKSGVSKMTFYKYFDNKEDFFLFILREFYNWGGEMFMKIWGGPGTFVEKITRAVKFKMQLSRELSKEMVLELLNSPYPKIKAALAEYQAFWLQKILSFYLEAQQKGEIRPDIKPEFILFVLNHVSMWAEDKQLLQLYDDPTDLLREVLNFYINGLIAKEPIVS